MPSWSPQRLRKGARGLLGAVLHGRPIRFNPDKQALIDRAFHGDGLRTFADLGGVWGIDGAYTGYILSNYPIDRAWLVDTNLTPRAERLTRRHPRLEIVRGNFGDPRVAGSVGPADAILLFDVLLHQVRPDWDEILALYAPRTRRFLVFNQQWIRGDATVRLLDLGVDEYFRHVRFDRSTPGYREIAETPEAIHPEHGRPWRDVHNVWQWGITDRDLVARMDRLGFGLEWRRNFGRFSDWESFENHAFLFSRRSPAG